MAQAPDPLMVVDGFAAGTAEVILRYAIGHEADFRPAKVALGPVALVDETRRVARVNRAVGPLLPLIEPLVTSAVDKAVPMLGLVNVAPYLLELELGWCGDGGFFKRHSDALDRFPAASQRVMTVVHYVCTTPKAFTGGRLRLYGLGAQAGICIAEVEPAHDRAVFFPSWLPHEVLPVRCEGGAFADGRFAISCWVRRNAGKE